MGGSPTRSVKRRARAARETPVSAASPATVHPWAGSACISRRARPTTGSRWARYQAGAASAAWPSQVRSTAMSRRSSSRSRTAALAGGVLDDLVGEQRQQRALQLRLAQGEQRRERRQQPPADL